MKVVDIITKLEKIGRNIDTVTKLLPTPCFPGQEPLCYVIESLEEYRDVLLDMEVK